MSLIDGKSWWEEHQARARRLTAICSLEHRAEANRLQERIGELEAEKAQHLAQIAANTQRPQTQADVNAGIFRKHLRVGYAGGTEGTDGE